MKDQLRRYLLPSADMKKAIDRNMKEDEDLLLVWNSRQREKGGTGPIVEKTRRLKKANDKETGQLSPRNSMQFFQHRNVADRANRPRLMNHRRKRDICFGDPL
ncbi:hypothetical protein OS493_003564 [Desmophyllum pertusum]|uniref:Uncharacterized protein n=1 Tax=Desmophyllum pertusum TaxID=174260 RepID=A0A9X0DBT3_9CNID|nr:hypothetical protein OS493_003564 [Desmophyllum pertusum]